MLRLTDVREEIKSSVESLLLCYNDNKYHLLTAPHNEDGLVPSVTSTEKIISSIVAKRRHIFY